MSNNNINIKLKTTMSDSTKKLGNLTSGFNLLGKSTDKASNSYGGFIRQSKKLNNSFQNMTKDTNRSTNSIGRMSKGLFSLGGALKLVGIGAFAKSMADATQSNIEMIETIHLFEVAMGDFAESTDVAIGKLSELTGLDHTNLQNRVGTFNLLARSLGMTSKNASILSENSNRLSIDLASLYNTSITQVSEDMRSGLIGQSRTMYKYGIDVSEANLKVEAMNQGITKSVRLMSQGEKMALRYAIMIKHSALAHGDFAETINTPANQLKILSERFVTLTRSIGSLFVPMLEKVLPYLNAVLKVLTKIINALALFIGYKPPASVKNTDGGFGSITDDADDATNATNKTTKAIKKLRSVLGAFDEINILADPESGSGGKGKKDEGSGSPFDFELEGYDSLLDGIKQKSDEIAESMENLLQKFLDLSQPLMDADFTMLKYSLDGLYESLKQFGGVFGQGLAKFYSEVLVPLGVWAIENTLPSVIKMLSRFVDILTNVGKAFLTIDFKPMVDSLINLSNSLVDLGNVVLDNLDNIFKNLLIPLGIWSVENVLPSVTDAFARFVDVLVRGGEITSTIDFEPLVNSVKELWESLKPFASKIGDGLEYLFLEVLIPLGVWSVENLVPKSFELISKVLDVLSTTLDTLNPLFEFLMEEMLIPLGKFTGDLFIKTMDRIIEDLGKLSDWINNNQKLVESIAIIVGSLALAFGLVSGALAIFNGVATITSGILGVILSPIGLVVLAIGGLISIAVLLWKNWEELNAKTDNAFKKILDIIVSVAKGIGEWFTKIYKEFVEPVWKHMLEWLNKLWKDTFKDVLLELTNAVGKIGELIKFVWDKVFKPFGDWIGGKFLSNFTSAIKKTIDVVGSFAKDVGELIKSVLKIFNGLIDFITGVFTGNWSRAWSGVVKVFEGIVSGLATIFNAPLNAMIDGVNKFTRGISKIKVPDWVPGIGGNGFNIGEIPRLARGGSISAGELFEAGEFGKAELVGQYQGNTTVMPLENSGFIDAMKRAVMEGVSNSSGGSGNADRNPIIVNVGGRNLVNEVRDGINRQIVIDGKSTINV